MTEETKSHGGTQLDDEIFLNLKGNNVDLQPQPDPSDPLYGIGADETTVADSIKSLLNEIRAKDATNATLLYKIRENKSSAFRKNKDRYNGDGSTFISFRDDAERHLLKHQFSPSISLIHGKNIFFQYPQLTVSEGRHEVNYDFDPTIIDDDLLFYYTLLDSLDPEFRETLGTAPQESERTNGHKSGRLLWLHITDKVAESSSTLKQICDDLEALTLDSFNGSVTAYVRRCKTDIARLKGNDFDYNANHRLTEAIFDTLLGGTGHAVFTNKLSSEYNDFTSLPLSKKKTYDVHTVLDMAVDTFTPLYRTKKWKWSSDTRSNQDDMQMITALTAEIRTLQSNLQKLRNSQHYSSDTKNGEKPNKVYPPTTAKKYRKNNPPHLRV